MKSKSQIDGLQIKICDDRIKCTNRLSPNLLIHSFHVNVRSVSSCVRLVHVCAQLEEDETDAAGAV